MTPLFKYKKKRGISAPWRRNHKPYVLVIPNKKVCRIYRPIRPKSDAHYSPVTILH